VRLLLIRHGQSLHNLTGILGTAAPGPGLTDLGGRQAAAVPAALEGERIDAVRASTLVRTQLTAAPLATARGLDVAVDAGFAEVEAGDFELRSDEEAVRGYTGALAAWMRGELDRAMPGGPTGREFADRYAAAVDRLAAGHAPDATVVAFSHSAAMRVFTTVATGLAPQRALELSVMNTGMAVLEGDPVAGWSLTGWHTEPLGGRQLEDASAHDVTGETVEEVEQGAVD
jgi:broad specificity phosphatase PhoE